MKNANKDRLEAGEYSTSTRQAHEYATESADTEGKNRANQKQNQAEEAKQQRNLAQANHQDQMSMQNLQHKQRMKDSAEEHKYTLDNIILRARLEREKNREIIEDKKKGDLARIDSESRIQSASSKTDLAKDMLSSKSGIHYFCLEQFCFKAFVLVNVPRRIAKCRR